LILDDYLHAVADMRRTFKLPEPSFRLEDVEKEAGAKAAIRAIVDKTIQRHGVEIYTKPHQLLDDVGMLVYGERTETPAYSGDRIRKGSVEPALRRIIEVGLQTLTQLPARDQKPAPEPRLKALAKRLDRLAGELDSSLRNEAVRARKENLFQEGSPDRERIEKLSDELHWGASSLDGMAKLKLKRVWSDSQNPQIRWALYFVEWIASSTGSQQYGNLATLGESAFSADGKSVPGWVDRLAIEMNLKRKRRKRWAGAISE
jgi:hypothetical protein